MTEGGIQDDLIRHPGRFKVIPGLTRDPKGTEVVTTLRMDPESSSG